MESFQGVFLIIGYGFGIIYSFWPLLILAPIGWRGGNILRAMTGMWVLLFFGWLMARRLSLKPLIPIIPEPTNTYVFFLAGLILIAWPIFRKVREHRYIHKTADTARNPGDLLDISPAQFEKMVVELYILWGYNARRTGSIGDHGVDVIVDTPKGEKWVVQCKRWRGIVGEHIVREFIGTMHHEKADRGNERMKRKSGGNHAETVRKTQSIFFA